MTPAALAPLLLMQSATDPTAAVHHAIDAVLAGASAAEAQQALDEWVALQGAQVQQMFTGPARRDCCTGVERDHAALAASMDRHPSGRDLPACKCSHTKAQHGTDRRDRPTCFGSVVCGCTTYRPKEQQQ